MQIEYGLKKGTTENTYLIQGASAAALVDVPDQAFSQAFLKALASKLSPGSLQHLVLGHVSPKRVATLVALAGARPESAPPLNVWCSNPAAKLLETALADDAATSARLSVQVVRAGDTLDLGSGHQLQFVLTPTPRWPDGMCTYDPATQLLFTHKLFRWRAVTLERWPLSPPCLLHPEPYLQNSQLFCSARQAEAALERLPITAQFGRPSYSGKSGIDVVKADLGYVWNAVLGALKLDLRSSAALARTTQSLTDGITTAALCPLHGPVVRSSLTELVRDAYGNTSALAQAISRGIMKAGVGIETVNCEQSSGEEVAAIVKKCSGFAIGSPTLGGHMPTPIQETLGVILRDAEARAKPCGVFGSFGWSGEAVDEMEQRLKDGGFSFAFPPIRCKFKPTEAMLQTCEESGTDLAQAVKKLKKKAVKDGAGAQFSASTSSVEQAVGRVVGSLCVVTAKSGDAESAMLASWVSQASFNPPGVTLAVAKERAVEGILLQGGQFVLNVLGQDKAGPISKQLLKPFAPGETRYGDLPVRPGSASGASIASLECTVQGRMEAGDHWVLYASVTDGELQNDKVLTAVHHRKTGARY
eukprot:jgi/Mesen1/5779/ME000293S04930